MVGMVVIAIVDMGVSAPSYLERCSSSCYSSCECKRASVLALVVGELVSSGIEPEESTRQE